MTASEPSVQPGEPFGAKGTVNGADRCGGAADAASGDILLGKSTAPSSLHADCRNLWSHWNERGTQGKGLDPHPRKTSGFERRARVAMGVASLEEPLPWSEYPAGVVLFYPVLVSRPGGRAPLFVTIRGIVPIPTVLTIYADKSFTFETKTPPASVLLKQAAKIAKGSGEPNREKVGEVNKKQIEEIAKTKFEDLNAFNMASAMKIIEGTARSMGIKVTQ